MYAANYCYYFYHLFVLFLHVKITKKKDHHDGFLYKKHLLYDATWCYDDTVYPNDRTKLLEVRQMVSFSFKQAVLEDT